MTPLINADVKVGNDQSAAEESNSSSGVTTEEVFPDLNLELSIGLPYDHQLQITSIKNIQTPPQPQPQQQQQQWYGDGSQGVCLYCHLGFQNTQACTCKGAMGATTTTTLTPDNIYRFYRAPLNS